MHLQITRVRSTAVERKPRGFRMCAATPGAPISERKSTSCRARPHRPGYLTSNVPSIVGFTVAGLDLTRSPSDSFTGRRLIEEPVGASSSNVVIRAECDSTSCEAQPATRVIKANPNTVKIFIRFNIQKSSQRIRIRTSTHSWMPTTHCRNCGGHSVACQLEFLLSLNCRVKQDASKAANGLSTGVGTGGSGGCGGWGPSMIDYIGQRAHGQRKYASMSISAPNAEVQLG